MPNFECFVKGRFGGLLQLGVVLVLLNFDIFRFFYGSAFLPPGHTATPGRPSTTGNTGK